MSSGQTTSKSCVRIRMHRMLRYGTFQTAGTTAGRTTFRLLCTKNDTGLTEQKRNLNDALSSAPKLTEVSEKNAKFDEITHTGQAWDQADVRLARFTYSKKQVNPNIAAHLISEQKPIACEDHVIFCDGGHAGLGHPKVYINLDKPGTHACGYCGLRFYNPHTTNADQVNLAHIQV